jgi:hypothetical protein
MSLLTQFSDVSAVDGLVVEDRVDIVPVVGDLGGDNDPSSAIDRDARSVASDLSHRYPGTADEMAHERHGLRYGAADLPGPVIEDRIWMMPSAVLDKINAARADPADFAETLHGPGSEDAIQFLKAQTPLQPISESPALDRAAQTQADDQGPRGGTSHIGSDGSGPMSRAHTEGVFSMVVAEEIAVSQTTAQDVVSNLLIDANPNRPGHPHRADLFNPAITLGGVACGPNSAYGEMCVIDLASKPIREVPVTPTAATAVAEPAVPVQITCP